MATPSPVTVRVKLDTSEIIKNIEALKQSLLELSSFVEKGPSEAEIEDKEAADLETHDDLRTSEIALKALALYNGHQFVYKTWDVVNSGRGCCDGTVQYWIDRAESQEKEAAEKRGQRRNELTSSLVGIDVTYASRSKVIQRAVDKIIELEDKLA